jgi:type VI secretion system secreted protein Hcp
MARAAAFLDLEGVKGEATDEGHKDQIEVESFSWGGTNPSSREKGSTGHGSGQASLGDLHIVMSMNKATPPLIHLMTTGKHVGKAVLSLNKATGEDKMAGLEYMKVELKEVSVTSYQIGGSGNGGIPMDSFSLAYDEIKFDYNQQTEKGGKGAQPKAAFNVRTGKATVA